MATIGLIGLGNMGAPMAANLVKAGERVLGFDLVPALCQAAAKDGVEIVTGARQSVQDSEIVITMLPAGEHVRAVWADVLPAARKGALFIDCSTIDVASARAAHAMAAEHGIASLDAPVSGGVGGAKAATLTFMVGGAAEALARGKPVLERMGKRVVHCGEAGNGQVAKICNNMMLAIEMIATSEGMSLAAKLGMDPKVFAGIVNTSSGRCWSSDTYNPYPGVLENVPASRGYSGGFGADLMLKDLTLVTEAAKAARQPVMLGALAQQIYQKHSLDGHGTQDFSSVILQYMKA
jgi:3-hydroxyisobutyrate dehydrogenase